MLATLRSSATASNCKSPSNVNLSFPKHHHLGITYDIVNSPPSFGVESDDFGNTRPVAFLKWQVFFIPNFPHYFHLHNCFIFPVIVNPIFVSIFIFLKWQVFIFSRFLAFLICHYFHSHNFSHIFCCFYCNFNPIFDSIFIFLFCRVCIRCLSKLMLNLILILEPVIQQLSSKLISNLSVEPAIHRGRLHSWVHDGPCIKVAESSNCQMLSTMNLLC